MRRKLHYKSLMLDFQKRCTQQFFNDNRELFEILICDLLEEQDYYEKLQKITDEDLKMKLEVAKMRDKVVRRIQTGFRILSLKTIEDDEMREKSFLKNIDKPEEEDDVDE